MLQKIPFLNIKAINERYKDQFHLALEQVLDSGQVLLGKQTADFEAEYANFCDTRYAIGVANGLEALSLVLKAWQIGPGDEVIVPSNTYIATWLAVTHVGAKIVPVEPKIDTYNIDVSLIEKLSHHAQKSSYRSIYMVKPFRWMTFYHWRKNMT